jgi:FlaA1/EpsC-like NDP-sugar epimerase
MNRIDISNFIKKSIIKRETSFFYDDIEEYKTILSTEINNKSVLVIGGAGTIGSSFIKQLLKFNPLKLVVVDINENALTELTRDLRSCKEIIVPKTYLTYPMNFGSTVFKKMFLDHSPFNIVANFAAYKHVRSEKDKYSIESMLENNIFRSKKLLQLLSENSPEHFFCVSTDKAANPVNVMGASKKIMEELIISYSNRFKISTARFANVAFSNGSLLDGFNNRINMKQPISCPSDVKRFFVSPEESGQICLLACILGRSGDIFFPKLNQNDLINFKDICTSYFKQLDKKILICKNEEEAKKFSITSDKNQLYPVFFFKSNTSGEKLYEEFYTEKDNIINNKFKSMGIIRNSINFDTNSVHDRINQLRELIDSNYYNKESIIILLEDFIEDFSHIERGKDLDQGM